MKKFPMLVNEDDELLCPYCHVPDTHVESALVYRGNRGEEPILGLVAGTVEEKRDLLTIRLHCEAGHNFNIHMQQRTGRTEISYEKVK